MAPVTAPITARDKVRRFNFLLFSDFESESLKLMRNPDVSVRSRGVMEKCSYCVQRIAEAKIDADKENRGIRDGEVVTACQQACPAGAITFGNLNDKNSKVAKLHANERTYSVLADLNTRPRTQYVAAVLNPTPNWPRLRWSTRRRVKRHKLAMATKDFKIEDPKLDPLTGEFPGSGGRADVQVGDREDCGHRADPQGLRWAGLRCSA